MLRLESILKRKSTLFSVVVLFLVGTLAVPIIIPHVFHGIHLIHIGLHIAGLALAVFISIIAIMAFFRLRTKRLLFTSIAFTIFIAAESVLLIDATWPTMFDIGDLSLLEVGHTMTIITLGLLALGVFRND